MIFAQAVPASWDGMCPASKGLVIEGGALDRLVQVLCQGGPSAITPVVYNPGITLEYAAGTHKRPLVGHEVRNMVGVCGPQDGHQ